MIEEQRVLRIQFEYSRWNSYSRALLRDLLAFFRGLPYDLFKITPRELIPVPVCDPALGNFQYKDFAVLHRSVAESGR